ncbi:Trihelix transcription factor ASR3 [Linum grandiflorum]
MVVAEMEEAEPIRDTGSSLEPKRRGKKPQAEPKRADEEEELRTTTRMTRSKASSEWTTKESLVLVNVIAAIDGDWLRVLASLQKWKFVADNCNLLDVRRNLYQCREKWSSLLSEYIRIRRWNSNAGEGCECDPYWSLDSERRKLSELPLCFDDEVFKAIDTYARTNWEELDSDTETDPEADAELFEVIARLGSKCKRRRRYRTVVEKEERSPEGLSGPCSPEDKPLQYDYEENLEESCAEEMQPEEEHTSEKCQPEEEHTHETCDPEEEHAHCWTREKDVTVKDEEVHESHDEEGIRKIPEEDENGAAQEGISVEQKDQSYVSETTMQSCETEGDKGLQPHSMGVVRPYKRGRKPRALVEEEKMVEEMFENSKLVVSVATGSYPGETDHLKDGEGSSEKEFVRYQADKLVECLGRIVNIIDRYPYLVQKYS